MADGEIDEPQGTARQVDAQTRVDRLRAADARRDHGGAEGRVPPGQVLTSKFPVLTYGPTPRVTTDAWRLKVWGQVDAPLDIGWAELLALPQQTQVCDIHCVTRWSKLDTSWTGVPFRVIHEAVRPRPGADFVLIHGTGGYTTNMRVDEMLDEDVLVAHRYEGEPIEREHGGPVRLIVPKLYFWKSAKWLSGFEYGDRNTPGFWERYGYHLHGDPWTEERFG